MLASVGSADGRWSVGHSSHAECVRVALGGSSGTGSITSCRWQPIEKLGLSRCYGHRSSNSEGMEIQPDLNGRLIVHTRSTTSDGARVREIYKELDIPQQAARKNVLDTLRDPNFIPYHPHGYFHNFQEVGENQDIHRLAQAVHERLILAYGPESDLF